MLLAIFFILMLVISSWFIGKGLPFRRPVGLVLCALLLVSTLVDLLTSPTSTINYIFDALWLATFIAGISNLYHALRPGNRNNDNQCCR